MSISQKQLALISLFLLIVAICFWSGSRYPDLNEKALMGGDMPNMGLSFDTVSEINEKDSPVIGVLKNTLNWIETNKKGMTFGMIFAAALMMLFTRIKEKQFENKFLNSIFGLFIGAPLGVCVNCATPIGKGIYDAGGKTETAISTMISSPTFNFIVITMLFSLFPIYIIALKLIATAGIILIAIPLIVTLFEPKSNISFSRVNSIESTDGIFLFSESIMLKNSWIEALKWFGLNYGKSLWFIVKTTLPLMLLAGFLGNVIITFFPFEDLVNGIPNPGAKFALLWTTLLVASFGVLLPVPMTFDLIIVTILLSSGLGVPYATTLLITLGSFSIYPFFIIFKDISKKIAIGILIAVILAGSAGGFSSFYLQRYIYGKQFITHFDTLKKYKNKDTWLLNSADSVQTVHNIKPFFRGQSDVFFNSEEFESGVVKISSDKLRVIDSTSNTTLMSLVSGDQIGLTSSYKYGSKYLYMPRNHQRSLSAGDLDKDGFVDIATVSADSIFFYFNKNGQYFEKVNGPIIDASAQVVALIDFNNDDNLDLFVSTWREGNFIYYQDQGSFSLKHKFENNLDLNFTIAPAFSDLNNDGLIDVYFGNFYHSRGSTYASNHSRNFGYFNKGETWERFQLESNNGETLSCLLSDINMDGNIDIVEGNDFLQRDFYNLGTGTGVFKTIKLQDDYIEVSTDNTMSIISGDINNDLIPEIYLDATNSEGALKESDELKICKIIQDSVHFELCKLIINHKKMLAVAQKRKDFNLLPKWDLLGASAYVLSSNFNGKRGDRYERYMPDSIDFFSEYVTEFDPYAHQIITTKDNPDYFYNSVKAKKSKSRKEGNAVLLFNENDRFVDKSKEFGVENSGWAWNTKMADLDNDEWQDIFICNGFNFRRVPYQNNIFYKNIAGKMFEDKTSESGLDNFLPVTTHINLDIDLDGDLDMVLAPQFGPLLVYKNNTNSKANSILFKFKDSKGNINGIGNKVFIYYGNGSHQYREILASGGFRGFDSPIAHFGIGNHDKVNKVEVVWSTGDTTIVNQVFEAGYQYTLYR